MTATYKAESVSTGCRVHESFLSHVGMSNSSSLLARRRLENEQRHPPPTFRIDVLGPWYRRSYKEVPRVRSLPRIGIATAILALLLLDFAALDDITTGNEPHLYLEYAILGISLPLLGACWWGLSRLRRSG